MVIPIEAILAIVVGLIITPPLAVLMYFYVGLWMKIIIKIIDRTK